MATKNKYQRQKQQYSNDGGQTWFDVVPANYRKGSLIEEASEDCNTTQWVEVQNAWYCIGDSVDIQYRWVDIEQTMCNGYDKYSMQKQQQSTDGGVTWTDTGNTRQGTLIEANSVDCGYKTLYQWVTVQNEYICNGYDKYVKEKQQKSTDGGVTWTDTGNTRQGNVIELNSEDCGYVVNKRWITVEGEYICNGYDKYVKEKEQQSTDGGITWTDTGNTRQGALIEANSVDCGYKPGYENQYLTMEALDNATIEVYPQYTDSKLYYKIDNEEWKEFNNNSKTISLNTSSKIMFKETLTSSRLRATRFKCSSGHINVYGNIMSLVYGDDFIGKTTMSDFSLEQVFNGSNIINAGNLILPATTLSNACYSNMFYNCASLTQAPQLPATTLKLSCYAGMFQGCTSLTTAPELPTTTLAEDCYQNMFYGCTSLTQAPQLPATTLAEGCYMAMFHGCTSLTQAPVLPATTLAEYCYYGMFAECTSLTSAPQLPATTLSNACYYGMFAECTSLTSAPQLPATTLSNACYSNMFSDCTSLVNAPELPATTLAYECYYYMFEGCTSLVNAPELPATTLAEYCYSHMFEGCTSLVNAPELPATILANYCYKYMFWGCTSLVNAPVLLATTLKRYCYWSMFAECTSLTSAPELPATTLAKGCYYDMFEGCTSLTTAPVLPATTFAEWCYSGMFWNCTSLNNINCQLANVDDTATKIWVNNVQTNSGTFTYNCLNNGWTTGISGIPENWTRQCE